VFTTSRIEVSRGRTQFARRRQQRFDQRRFGDQRVRSMARAPILQPSDLGQLIVAVVASQRRPNRTAQTYQQIFSVRL
jgi:hypothetical protein